MQRMEWVKSFSDLWQRGSFLLWTLALAAMSALMVGGAFVFFLPDASQDILTYIPKVAVAAVVLVVFAAAKTLQERGVRTLAFVPNEGQSFWHLAPQKDGRRLTQIALHGVATNTSKGPIYLADVRLLLPGGKRTNSRHIITQAQNSNLFSSDHAIPAGGRSEFSAHFFVDGFVDEQAAQKTFVIGVSDQVGHWHRVRFPNLRRT
jgi:hypothetical protein